MNKITTGWRYCKCLATHIVKVDSNYFCSSYQISLINKNYLSNKPLKPKTYFKCVVIDIVPAISSKSLTQDTNFDHYLLNVDAYSKMKNIME